jgi:hypothetical protein
MHPWVHVHLLQLAIEIILHNKKGKLQQAIDYIMVLSFKASSNKIMRKNETK